MNKPTRFQTLGRLGALAALAAATLVAASADAGAEANVIGGFEDGIGGWTPGPGFGGGIEVVGAANAIEGDQHLIIRAPADWHNAVQYASGTTFASEVHEARSIAVDIRGPRTLNRREGWAEFQVALANSSGEWILGPTLKLPRDGSVATYRWDYAASGYATDPGAQWQAVNLCVNSDARGDFQIDGVRLFSTEATPLADGSMPGGAAPATRTAAKPKPTPAPTRKASPDRSRVVESSGYLDDEPE